MSTREANIQNIWKKGILQWEDGDAVCLSVVFTWFLPEAKKYADMMRPRRVRIGGPAIGLSLKTMPGFWLGCHAELGGHYPGVLQRFNHLATRTSIGCPRRCDFCSVPIVAAEESVALSGQRITALSDWPDLPVLADDNLLFTPMQHFDRVCDRLEKWEWCDFNQGIDCRVLSNYHAERIARIKRPTVRMALDFSSLFDTWDRAFDKLRRAGIAKHNIRTYCILANKGENGEWRTPDEAWKVCRFVESRGVKPSPMWFHGLNAMERNKVTLEQEGAGWNDYERRKIMQWFYQHKEAAVSAEARWSYTTPTLKSSNGQKVRGRDAIRLTGNLFPPRRAPRPG